ncbi:hypothetical protein L8P27_00500 [Enterobacter asburiae]|uniref:hypothetical protein n=1 Tax=Enterobacter asburiae TaxID=61645 RepID=UPI0020060B21|nr:hypothetical protein [Enterobacter asburiae]MCK7226343.1 hypothetical protein [Enterobacter asburiae]
MARTSRIFPYLLSGAACLMLPFIHAAELYVKGIPEFKDYPADISKGPFATRLDLSSEQAKYSSHWKKITSSELKESVNFGGHYRIYTDDKSSGNECLDHQGGVCGWVIDKLSGKVVSQLPAVAGTNVYQQVADNGTPVGEDFRIDTQKSSYLMILTGQAIPQKIEHDENGIPITYPCNTTYYILKNNQFSKVFEDNQGCSVD